MAARLKAMGSAHYQNDGDPRTSGPGFALTVHPDALSLPLRWRKPRRVFVNSMSDLFHPDVPDEFVLRVWETMRAAPQHTYQCLTKRPQRMMDVVSRLAWRTPTTRERAEGRRGAVAYLWADGSGLENQAHCGGPSVLSGTWLGVSIESDRYVWRANYLRQTPAALRFLSLEPLLGPLPSLGLAGIGWVIVGAESGRGARPMDDDWVRDIRDRCVAADIPFFFKQRAVNGRKVSLPELDGRQWAEFPAGRV